MVKPATKASKKPAAKEEGGATLEPITVVKMFTSEGERNEDSSETLEHVKFPEGTIPAKVSVNLGVAGDYGKVKASVMVTVPALVEELDDAASFAYTKAQEYLDGIAGDTADSDSKSSKDDDDEEETKKPAGKKSSSKDAKGKGGKKKPEPEEEEDEDDDADDDSGDDDEETEIEAEDIRKMNRKELETFIDEYKGDDDAGDELDDIDPSEFKKGAAGLKELQEAVIEALPFDEDGEDGDEESDEDGEEDEEYTEESLGEMDLDDLQGIFKEWKLGKMPKGKTEKATKKLIIAAILEAQENAEEDDD